MSTEMEKVNHPQYYNQHPSGVECIDIIRNYVCDIANAFKYLWRAGLKGEEGMTRIDKEIEDLQKAVWYIRDFIDSYVYFSCQVRVMHEAHHPPRGHIALLRRRYWMGYPMPMGQRCGCGWYGRGVL